MNIAERDVAKPWHYRTRIFPARTFSGRVVYNRDKHFFGISDIERITKKINPPELPVEDAGNRWRTFFAHVFRAYAGTLLPNIFDMPKTFGEYMSYAIENTAEVLTDPVGALKRRTIDLILELANLMNIRLTIDLD